MTSPYSSNSLLSRILLLHLLPAFRAGLDESIPSLGLEHVPILDADSEPRAVVLTYLNRGGFASLLRETRGLQPLQTFTYFARSEWVDFCSIGIAMTVRAAALGAVPYCIENLLATFEEYPSGSSALLTRASLACIALFFAFLASALASPTAWYTGAPLAARSSNVLFALGAAKTLLLARHAKHAGEAAQLLTKYAPVFSNSDLFTFIHVNTWVTLAQIFLGTWRITSILGVPAAAAALGVLAFLTISAFVTRGLNKQFDRAANTLSSERVGVLQELLRGVLVLRALGWVHWFEERVGAIRNRELGLLGRAQALRVAVDTLFALTGPLSAISALLAYAATHGGSSPKPAAAFAALAWLTYVTGPVRSLPALIQVWTDVSVFLGRFRTLLCADEAPTAHMKAWRSAANVDAVNTDDTSNGFAGAPSPALSALEVALLCALSCAPPAVSAGLNVNAAGLLICVHDIDVCVYDDVLKAPVSVLQSVSLTLAPGELVMVVGQSAAGKTLLLRALIGDTPTRSSADTGGRGLSICARTAYVPQNPLLPRGTLSNAIRSTAYARAWGGTRGDDDDDAWYTRVIVACGLDLDIASLPEGDMTDVGDGGSRLSGGQRVRVALAGALFAGARAGAPSAIFVLDDIFAAVDARVGDSLHRDVICGIILDRGHAVVIATHSLQFAARACVSRVLVLGRRTDGLKGVIAYGAYSDVATSVGVATVNLLEKARAVLPDVQSPPPHLSPPTPPLATLIRSPPIAASVGLGGGSDAALDNQLSSPFVLAWRAYAGAVGAPRGVALAVLYVIAQTLLVGQAFWLRDWADNDFSAMPEWVWSLALRTSAPTPGVDSQAAAARVYMVATGLLAAATLIRLALLTTATLNAARSLHQRALVGWVSAPAAAISIQTSGNALNRFERDVDHVDTWVRPNILLVATASFSLVGSVIIVSVSAPLLLAWLALVGLVYWRLARIYARVILRLRSLDAASASGPVGRWREATVPDEAARARAAGPRATAEMLADVIKSLSAPTRTKLAAAAGSQAAGNILFSAGYTVTLAASVLATALVYRGQLSAAAAALLVATVYSFNSDASALVSNIGYLEQSAVSIARLAEFAGAEGEDEAHARILSKASKVDADQVALQEASDPLVTGAVSLRARNLGLNYSITDEAPKKTRVALIFSVTSDGIAAPLLGGDKGDDEEKSVSAGVPWALRGLTFDIRAGLKVAVVGRTGSGKSSLFAALLRNWPHQEGSLWIGGVDVGGLRRAADARALISALPQGGLAFDGSVRENLLGPLSSLAPGSAAGKWLASAWADSRVLSAARAAAGTRLADGIARAGGLDAHISGGGTGAKRGGVASAEWSRGEMALLSVARLCLQLDIATDAATSGVLLPISPPARVILLDEPSADVDVEADEALLAALLSRRETLLCIVHRREFLGKFDAVLEIDGGHGLPLCTPSDFLARGGH